MTKEKNSSKIKEEIDVSNDEHNIKLTEEAEKKLSAYLSSLVLSYKDIGLNAREISGSIEEVREHVLKLGSFYAGNDKLVSTDLVNKAIKKLGDPEIIKRTLYEEDAFMKAQKSSFENHILLLQTKNTKSLGIKVINLVRIFTMLSWIMTSSIIFTIFQYENALFIGQVAYLLIAIIIFVTRSSSVYKNNSILQTKISFNPHIVVFPFIYLFYVMVFSDYQPFVLDPIMFTLWLILHTDKINRNYYVTQLKLLRSNFRSSNHQNGTE